MVCRHIICKHYLFQIKKAPWFDGQINDGLYRVLISSPPVVRQPGYSILDEFTVEGVVVWAFSLFP